MACVADTLVTAPFATLGSIGVMAMIPNFHERLEREGIHVSIIFWQSYCYKLCLNLPFSA